MKRFWLYIFVVLFISCQKDSSVEDSNSKEINQVSFAATKGSGSKKSFRVYLNGIENTVAEGIETSGSYYDQTEGMPLQPCSVDEYGNFVALDDSKGLRSINGSYKLHIVSPAVEMVPIEGYTNLNGYKISRDLGQDENPIYLSSIADVTLSGVYLTGASGLQHNIYDASSHILKQQRSKIKIKYACGNDIASTTLQKITLSNIINVGYYRPVESRFYYAQEDIINYAIDKTVLPDVLPLTITNPNFPNGTNPNEPIDLGVEQYILSMNYGELDSQGHSKWPFPSFVIETGGSESDVVVFTAALGWNFEPQHTYEFTITINSIYVNIEVAALPWDENGKEDTSIENPKRWSIDFPITDGEVKLLEWEEIDNINGTIE